MTEPIERAFDLVDGINGADPFRLVVDGVSHPKELIHGQMATAWLVRLAPEASLALRLAARAHHIRRWAILRSEYPEGRHGYLRWRTALHAVHAAEAMAVAADAGLGAETGARAAELVAKRAHAGDAEAQLLEDVLCLVFLETQFGDLAGRLRPGALPGVVQKTWAKMSARAREVALTLNLSESDRRLIRDALAPVP